MWYSTTEKEKADEIKVLNINVFVLLSSLIIFAGVVVNSKAYLEYVSGSLLWNWWSPDEALKDLQILQDSQCLNSIIAVTLLAGLFAKMMVYFGLARKKLNLDENAICSVIVFVCLTIFILYVIGCGVSIPEIRDRIQDYLKMNLKKSRFIDCTILKKFQPLEN